MSALNKLPGLLVTGMNGLIGWHVYQKAKERCQTWGTYRKRHEVFLKEHCFRINLLDAAEVSSLLEKIRPDYVVHSWAMCDLDICETFPEMADRINVKGTKLLLDAVQKTGTVKKFIYMSTDHVFDGEEGNYHEDSEPSPKHVYGKTKLKAEKLVMASGLSYLIVRPGLVIGKSFQGNKGPRDFLFTRIRAGKPTHYFTDEWRSPILAETLASDVIDHVFSEKEGIVHISGEETHNRYELALKLAEEENLPKHRIFPRLRSEDEWAHIRPKNLSLKSIYQGEEI